jgi:hypothetical protein
MVPDTTSASLRFLLSAGVALSAGIAGIFGVGGRPGGCAAAADSAAETAADALGDPSNPSSRAFFETRIRPVLTEKCQACHSAVLPSPKGGLRVDSREGLLTGGDSGPAIQPGDAEASLLLQAIRYDGLEMPPTGRLPKGVVEDFERWVNHGAVDPRMDPPGARAEARGIDIEAGRSFWSFRPIDRIEPPATESGPWHGWPRRDLDRFVLAKLLDTGLEPSADADAAVWLRRVHFDLTGLPPTPEAIADFLADASSEARATVVERLLASPAYGERWGRHWLDIARFAESSGGGRSMVFREAWRYRDYVIAAFNADTPFDRFLVEQIAGDLLPHASPAEEHDHLVATGYLLLGATNYEEQDKRQLEMDVVDEQLDTIGRGLMGMTLGCARCHDHKFDPVPTADYYALAGILRSTDLLVHQNVSRWTERMLPVDEATAAAVAEHERGLVAAREALGAAKRSLAGLEPGSADLEPARGEVKRLEGLVKTLSKSAPQVPRAMAADDAKTIVESCICIRGDVHSEGRRVPRGVLAVATVGDPPIMPRDASGRLELARWIADAEHPLTSRVWVNRVWKHLFGQGIVRSVDNFGATGELPSHPDLLDFLARRFTDGGWSTKSLVREIVLSRTYALSTAVSPSQAEVDPENRLLARGNRRRLDAESLRDAMLVVSGRLDATAGGPGITDSKVLAGVGTDMPTEYGYVFTDTRRSVYTPAFRNRRPDLFDAFDAADPNAVTGNRGASTVAPQALFMLNSPFVMDLAEAAAARLLAEESAGTDADRIERAFLQSLARSPTPAERAAVGDVLDRRPQEPPAAWASVFQALFGCIDFRTLE